MLQIVFWFDFGFIRYKSTCHKLIVKISLAILTTVKGIICLTFLGFELGKFYVLFYSGFILEYYVYVAILLLTPEKKTYSKFLENLQWIDTKFKMSKCTNYFDFKTLTWCIFSFLFKIISSCTYCKYSNKCPKDIYVQGLFETVLLSLDIPLAVLCFVFHATSVRLVALRKCIKSNTLKPKQAQLIYKHLIDSVENIKKSFDPIVSIVDD